MERIVVVEDSALTRHTFKRVVQGFKKRACEYAGQKCEKCEAAYEHNDKTYCCFDTVIRFMDYEMSQSEKE